MSTPLALGISEKTAWGSLPEGAPVAAGAAFQLWTEGCRRRDRNAGAAAPQRFSTKIGKWLDIALSVLTAVASVLCEPGWQRCRFGWLLVSWIIAGDDRTRRLTDILTSWSRGNGRRSGREFTATR